MASGEVAALWREDAHRGLASIDLQQSVAVPSSFSAHVLTSVTQNTASPIDSPPHPIALRI